MLDVAREIVMDYLAHVKHEESQGSSSDQSDLNLIFALRNAKKDIEEDAAAASIDAENITNKVESKHATAVVGRHNIRYHRIADILNSFFVDDHPEYGPAKDTSLGLLAGASDAQNRDTAHKVNERRLKEMIARANPIERDALKALLKLCVSTQTYSND